MLNANQVDRVRAIKMFGGIDYGPISDWLRSRGWTANGDWSHTPPDEYYAVCEEEYFAIGLLCDEWDYGGITRPWPKKHKSWFESEVARLTAEVEGAIEAAELFSDLLHRLEGRGIVLTPNEDRSWEHATQRVEKVRNLRTGAK